MVPNYLSLSSIRLITSLIAGQLLSPSGDAWIYSEVGWPGAGLSLLSYPALLISLLEPLLTLG